MIGFLHANGWWLGWATAIVGFLFSGLMSTMPPLPKDAGYWTVWVHDFLQWMAANWPKRQRADPAKEE